MRHQNVVLEIFQKPLKINFRQVASNNSSTDLLSRKEI